MNKPLTARQKLANLTDAMVEDILSLSDEELRAELIDDGHDPDEMARRVGETIRAAVRAAALGPYDRLPDART